MKIVLLGEAYGEQEEREGAPFVGTAGHILNGMLRQVGIRREDCHVTNVFNLRPPGGNDVKNLCGEKADALQGFGPLTRGKYCHKKYGPELERLDRELYNCQPNLVVALGATAAWALCGTSGIKNIRGAPLKSRLGFKVLPTYHPSAVGRDWSLRPVVLADLAKAITEAEFPDVRRPQRFIHIEPDLADLEAFEKEYIDTSPDLSIDIETKGRQITEIGFAPSHDRALVVPFYDRGQPDGNYWRTLTHEIAAWLWVRRNLRKAKRIVGQNFLYDMRFLWEGYGMPVPHAEDDTMLLHHALQPEMEKGLGFLGSIYTNEASWKFMRDDHSTIKRED